MCYSYYSCFHSTAMKHFFPKCRSAIYNQSFGVELQDYSQPSCICKILCKHSKGKGKIHPRTGHEDPEGDKMYSFTLPSTSMLDGGGWSAPRSGRFTPGKDLVPIVLEARWTPGSIWTDAENLSSTGIRPPDRPARSESLYRLSYPSLLCTQSISEKLCRYFYYPSLCQIFQCVSVVTCVAIKRLCVRLNTYFNLVYLGNGNNFHSQILKLPRILHEIRVALIIHVINQ